MQILLQVIGLAQGIWLLKIHKYWTIAAKVFDAAIFQDFIFSGNNIILDLVLQQQLRLEVQGS